MIVMPSHIQKMRKCSTFHLFCHYFSCFFGGVLAKVPKSEAHLNISTYIFTVCCTYIYIMYVYIYVSIYLYLYIYNVSLLPFFGVEQT